MVSLAGLLPFLAFGDDSAGVLEEMTSQVLLEQLTEMETVNTITCFKSKSVSSSGRYDFFLNLFKFL